MSLAEGMRTNDLVIIGLGATGCALLPLVSTMDIGNILLIDGDTIEERNLPRQPLYGKEDIGRYKVLVAFERTKHLHTDRNVEIEDRFIDAANIKIILKGARMVADCTDDIHVRGLIDRSCAELKIPLITGSVHGSQLQVMTLHSNEERQGSSLRSFFSARSGPGQDGCDMRDVPITVPAMAATLMARRIASLLSGSDGHLSEMDLIDLKEGQWLRISPPEQPEEYDLIAHRSGN